MIRIGIVGFDTSHTVEFTKRINHANIAKEQWVEGAEIVAGYSLPSSEFMSEEYIAKTKQTLRDELGVKIVNSPQEMMEITDAVMVEYQGGNRHLEAALPFLQAGLPTFVDKPFTCSVADAKKLVNLAQETAAPLFSSSSLRYALEIQKLKPIGSETGTVLGADVYSPSPLHPQNPGLFHYGIHGVEMLYSLMGQGCESVRCVFEDGWEITVGQWEDGRIGTMRGIRRGASSYGFLTFCEKKVVASTIDLRYIYRELVKQIVKMFQTRIAPIEPEETVEIIAFIEASMKSAERDGIELELKK